MKLEFNTLQTTEPTRTDLVQTVCRTLVPALIQEIHALLWIEPLVNRGIYDPGWNCRDHALMVAGILAAHLVPVQIVHGQAMFVAGPSGDRPPIGRGQDVNDTTTHTWVEVPSIGIVDISPNLESRGARFGARHELLTYRCA